MLNVTYTPCCIDVDRKENIDSVLQREYSVENVLGTGGFGTVYSGIRKQDSRAVS